MLLIFLLVPIKRILTCFHNSFVPKFQNNGHPSSFMVIKSALLFRTDKNYGADISLMSNKKK